MMNKSRGESAYLIFLFGSSQFSGNSARAKPKNEYDSVFACCCCWFDEFCVFVAFVLRVRVRVRVLLLLVLQLLLQPTLGAVVRAGRSSILKNKFVVVVVVVVVLIVVVEKIRLSSFLCVKKKRERETLKATEETDEQQAVKKKFGIKRETRSLHNASQKKEWKFRAEKDDAHTHTHHHPSCTLFFSLSLRVAKTHSMFITKFLQMAVKKGPFARGGLKWKGHGAFAVTQTRKTNAKKRLKYVNENDSVLREAAANDPKLIAMRMSEASSDGNNSSSSSSSSSE